MSEEQGDFPDKPRRKYFRKIALKKLENYIREHPDSYLREIAGVFACSIAAVPKALKSMGYSKKKRMLHTKNRPPQKVADYLKRIKIP